MQAERGEVHGAKIEIEDVLVRHAASAEGGGSVWREKSSKKAERVPGSLETVEQLT